MKINTMDNRIKINTAIRNMLAQIASMCGSEENKHIDWLNSHLQKTEDGDFFVCKQEDMQEILKILFSIMYAQTEYIRSTEELLEKYEKRKETIFNKNNIKS